MTLSRYDKLKELLARETYPHTFPFKFIGKKTPLFLTGVQNLELKYPDLAFHSQRETKSQNHISYTYLLDAKSMDGIVAVFQEIEKLSDLLMIL